MPPIRTSAGSSHSRTQSPSPVLSASGDAESGGAPAGITHLLRAAGQVTASYDLPHPSEYDQSRPNVPSSLAQPLPSTSSGSKLAPLLHAYPQRADGTGMEGSYPSRQAEVNRGEMARWENGGRVDEKSQEGEAEAEGEGDPNAKSLKTTKRAAQNRAAQRAFRERKENYVRELERKSVMLDETMTRERALASSLSMVQAEIHALRSERQDSILAQTMFHRERAGWDKERIEYRLEAEGWRREVEGLRGALEESRRMLGVGFVVRSAPNGEVETEHRD